MTAKLSGYGADAPNPTYSDHLFSIYANSIIAWCETEQEGRRMIPRCITGFITTAAIILSPLPVHADATLVVQGSDGLQSTIQLRNGKGKMSASGMDEYVIYDAGAGTVTYVEPQERRYTQISEAVLAASVQAAANLQQAAEPYLARMLAGMTQEQRRMIKQRMGAKS